MDKRLLERFFNGDCTPEEVDQIITSYYSGELSDDISDILKTYLKNPEFAEGEVSWDSKALFDKITHEIYGRNERVGKILEHPERTTAKSLIYPFWLKIAAGISILLAISFFLVKQKYFLEPTENTLVVTDHVVKSTSPSERLTIRLKDGSQVILNTASKITYPKEFETYQRTISLEGEAFFVVEKDEHRPFSVMAEGVVTTVLGTSFNINTRTEKEGEVEIALVEGSVKVRMEDQQNQPGNTPLFLNPGERLALSQSGHTRSKFNIKETTGWKDGIIYFESIPFEMVVSKLSKNYNVDFNVVYKHQEQKSRRYSGEFQNRSLEYILKNLSFSSDFTFEIKGDTVNIIFQ